VEALELAHREIQPIIALQEQMQREVGKPKQTVEVKILDSALIMQARDSIRDRLTAILDQPYSKENLYGGIDALKETYLEEVAASTELTDEQKLDYGKAFDEAERLIVRDRILNEGKRPDNRTFDEIREISCDVNISPRAHGSGLFTRGETQVLTLATLGTPKEAQELDNLIETEAKRYIHHYNFPPYCTGEVGRLGRQSRREIGHGALAERALVPVLPDRKGLPLHHALSLRSAFFEWLFFDGIGVRLDISPNGHWRTD